MCSVAFALEFSYYLVPPGSLHYPTRTLHSHSIINHLMLSFNSPALPRMSGEFISVFINNQLLIIRRRNIHYFPFLHIQKISPGSDYPIIPDSFQQNPVITLAKYTVLIGSHNVFTSRSEERRVGKECR